MFFNKRLDYYAKEAKNSKNAPDKFAKFLDKIVDNYLNHKDKDEFGDKKSETQQKLVELMRESPEQIHIIAAKLNEMADKIGDYSINCNGKYNVDLSGLGLTKLPDLSRFEIVGGDFDCSNNKITTLEGAPGAVQALEKGYSGEGFYFSGNSSIAGGTFRADNNKNLTDLKGAPSYVYGHFSISECRLSDLEHCPSYIGYGLDIRGNEDLHSIKGIGSVGSVYFNKENISMEKAQEEGPKECLYEAYRRVHKSDNIEQRIEQIRNRGGGEHGTVLQKVCNQAEIAELKKGYVREERSDSSGRYSGANYSVDGRKAYESALQILKERQTRATIAKNNQQAADRFSAARE